MHFTLDGKGVSVYTLRPKDKYLICLWHFLDHFRADCSHDFAVYHTSEIGGNTFCLVFLQILVLRLKNLHEKKGIAQKREMLLGFFLLCYALEDNDPAPTLPLGVTARLFFCPLQSQWYRFTASLFLSYLLYQILNQLSYSVVPAPFLVHTRIIHHKTDTCQTFVCDF